MPPDPAWRASLRLPRDRYVRVATNDYSVQPRAVGRRVEVRLDLDRVTVTCAGEVVADHPRAWARPVPVPGHAATLVALRAAAHRTAPAEVPWAPDLAAYDTWVATRP